MLAVLAVLAMLVRFAHCAWLRAAARGAALCAAAFPLPARAGWALGPRIGAERRIKMSLRIYAVAIEMVRGVRPVVERIGRRDSSLADQLRRAAASVPLNLQEGVYSQKGNQRARFHNALGSAAEVQACLDVAEALGYVEQIDPALRNTIDQVMATLHRLVQR